MSKRFLLLLIAFFSGMSIMAIEITSARLLAPYFGNSSFVWTNIIGVVMISLSFGYFYGGRLADNNPSLPVLLKIIALAAFLFLLVPWLLKPLSHWLTASLVGFPATIIIFFGSLLAALILFGIPLLLLGMISPFIIKLYAKQVSEVGTAAGTVFAVSTVGSIIGTYLPTLFTIPLLGSRLTIVVFACLLLLISFFGLVVNKIFFVFLLALTIPFYFLYQSRIKDRPELVYETESAYQYIGVERNNDDYLALVFNEGWGTQSLYHRDKILTDSYFDNWNLLPWLLSNTKNPKFLILGLAGGTLSRSLSHYFPQAKIDGVEIDKKVITTARRFFDLDQDNLNVINQDGRIYLDQSSSVYNLIMVDVYRNELYIPWTMTTREFWQTVAGHLEPAGLVAINVNADRPDSEILLSIANTLASVFSEIWIIPQGGESWNYMILGSRQAVSFKKLANDNLPPELESLVSDFLSKAVRYNPKPGGLLLTDDRAPIEFMTDKMIFRHFISR